MRIAPRGLAWWEVTETARYIDWTSPDGSLVVRIAEPVINRINVEVMRGFGVTRRRGTEVGGILIGHMQKGSPPVMVIDDCEPVACEYAYGPSYLLSPNDEAIFADAVNRFRPGAGREPSAVGYYRSHTRDGLSLDAPDTELYAKYLGADPGVALLIKPYATRSPVASFFPAAKGRLRTDAPPVEFTFAQSDPEAPALQPVSEPKSTVPAPKTAVPQPEPEPEPAPARPAETPVVRRLAPTERVLVDVLGPREDLPPDPEVAEYRGSLFSQYTPRQTPRWRTRLAWLLFTIAVFACGLVLGYQYAGGNTGSWLPLTEAIPVRDPYALSLSARLRGDSVVVEWNRFAKPVMAASDGVLVVNEAGVVKEVRLSQAELRSGVVLYRTAANEARFRLEVKVGSDRSVMETTEWRKGVPLQ